MRITRRRHREQGVTLLLTLMTLVILAVVIVQFQADAALQIRSSSYRLERLKCRYAAESALVMGSILLKEQLRQPLLGPRQPAGSPGETAETEIDPNFLEEIFEEPGEAGVGEKGHYVTMQEELEIGPARISFEVHDENAKWPLFWLSRPPYESGSVVERAFRKYAALMDVDSADARYASILAKSIGGGLNLPAAPVRIMKSRRTQRLARQGRRPNFAQRIAQDRARYTSMGAFAVRWHSNLSEDEKARVLKVPLESRPGTFADYISIWGANYINLNTAPQELIETAFEPLGLSKRQAEAIVKYRREKPFTNTGQLSTIEGMNVLLSNNIRSLCLTRSKTFSVHVEARLGRARYRLTGGMYLDHKGLLKRTAVFSGE